MTLSALPTFYPDIQEPNSNLADLVYLAANGSPIGRGGPWVSKSLKERSLEGLVVPDILERNRVTWGEKYALPAFVLLDGLTGGAPLPVTAVATLVAYMAPYPYALAMGALLYAARRDAPAARGR